MCEKVTVMSGRLEGRKIYVNIMTVLGRGGEILWSIFLKKSVLGFVKQMN